MRQTAETEAKAYTSSSHPLNNSNK